MARGAEGTAPSHSDMSITAADLKGLTIVCTFCVASSVSLGLGSRAVRFEDGVDGAGLSDLDSILSLFSLES